MALTSQIVHPLTNVNSRRSNNFCKYGKDRLLQDTLIIPSAVRTKINRFNCSIIDFSGLRHSS